MKNRMLPVAIRFSLAACILPVSGVMAVPDSGDHATSSQPPIPISQPITPFDRTLTEHGLGFHVSSPNAGSINILGIQPTGLKIDNSGIEREIEGVVTNAEVADLDADGSPELYVYIASAGSGSYGSLIAYSVNKGQSLSEVYLPPLSEDHAASEGYMGHDEFAVVENTLVRRFPVYRKGDTNANPTGGMRQIQYKLRAGEAGWVLRPDRTVAY